MALYRFLGVPTPDDLLFLRLFGAVIVAIGVAYWYAYKDPLRNLAILKAGVVDNGLVTLVIIIFTVFYHLNSFFMWISGALTLFFCVSFILLMPKTGSPSSAS